MKNRDEKKKDFEELRKTLEKANNVFVNGFSKLTVDQDYNLRKTIRGAGGSYKVVKNNIAEIAAEGTPSQEVLKGLKGMTSLAFTNDPVGLAKVLTGSRIGVRAPQERHELLAPVLLRTRVDQKCEKRGHLTAAELQRAFRACELETAKN